MPSDRIANLLEPKSEKPTSESQEQAPPAPPPMQKSNHDPYGFITNPSTPSKKKLLPGGNSMKSRIIISIAGVVILFVTALLANSFISGAGGGLKADYQSLAEQQAELIRVTDIGITKADQADARNLATTAKYALISHQPSILSFAKKTGAGTDAKTLALGKDSKTDALLTSAEQSNKFDEVFTETLQANLKKYQTTLKKIYDATTTKSTKDTLAKQYKDIGYLIQSEEGISPSSPATN